MAAAQAQELDGQLSRSEMVHNHVQARERQPPPPAIARIWRPWVDSCSHDLPWRAERSLEGQHSGRSTASVALRAIPAGTPDVQAVTVPHERDNATGVPLIGAPLV